MNGQDSLSDPVARRIRCTESYPSARLGSAQLGSARVWCRGRWVPLCWRVRWLDADMTCQLCMLASWLCHDDVILIRVWHVGQVVWYSGWVSLSGWRSRVWRVAPVCARGQSPRRRVTAREDCSDVRFWRGFHQWLRLFLLYTVVWSKHNFDNFHFWAKIKHYFKPSALIPIVGDSVPFMRWPVVFW